MCLFQPKDRWVLVFVIIHGVQVNGTPCISWTSIKTCHTFVLFWTKAYYIAVYVLIIHQQSVASCWLQELGTGVLTTSKNEKGGQHTDSVPMLTCRLPINPRLLLGLLGGHLVDIGMKLQLVHFAVQFCSASAPPWLWRTGLESTHYPRGTMFCTTLKF